MTDTDHDSAGIVAQFLADGLEPEDRRSVEAHMLGCDTCWAEMITARAGRTLAESLREPAPQSARETLRSIAADPLPEPVADPVREWPATPRRRPVRWLQSGFGGGRQVAAAALVAVVVAALTGVVSLLSAQPPEANPLQAAAAEYQVPPGNPADRGERPPAERIGDLVWTETTHKAIGSQQATLYRYAGPQGHRLVLISSTESFPRAGNAQAVGSGPEWMADIDGATVLCADSHGLSWLVVAGSEDEALAAGDAVGLPV
ncbi:MAG: hypothetical protein ACPGIJ_04460 [Mycobacterium sp.]